MSLTLAVLTASLLGSVHCVAMCGGFVCLYAAGRGDWRSHFAYHGGRLVSYLALGLTVGALGSALDRSGALAGVSRGAAIVSGGLLMVWGGATLMRLSGLRRARSTSSHAALSAFTKLQASALTRARDYAPGIRAAVVGMLSALLPCGWLYAFVATAAGTGSAFQGALTMGIFWLGTVPALLAAGVSIQRFAGPLRARLPALTAIVVIVIGALTMSGRLTSGVRLSSPASSGTHAHGS
jgi:hypothetical protein